MKPLNWIDKLAGKWLDWRTDRAVKNDPDLREMELHSLELKKGKVEAAIISPVVAHMADACSQMLIENHADNFVTFEMLPRYDRHIRTILVTVQWRDGKSPAQARDEMILAIKEAAEYFDNNCLNFQYEKMKDHIIALKKAAKLLL